MGQRGEAPGAEPSEQQPDDSRVRFAGGDGDDGPSTTPMSTTARKASMGARLKELRFQSQVGIALSLPSCPARLPRPLLTRHALARSQVNLDDFDQDDRVVRQLSREVDDLIQSVGIFELETGRELEI